MSFQHLNKANQHKRIKANNAAGKSGDDALKHMKTSVEDKSKLTLNLRGLSKNTAPKKGGLPSFMQPTFSNMINNMDK